MSYGASDKVYWRRAGLETFGVCGTFVDTTDIRAHGKDERVAVDAFYHSLEFSYGLMRSLSRQSHSSEHLIYIGREGVALGQLYEGPFASHRGCDRRTSS
jgi:hypothetical protein